MYDLQIKIDEVGYKSFINVFGGLAFPAVSRPGDPREDQPGKSLGMRFRHATGPGRA